MHLVIATREDPDLPLARLRAMSRLVETRVLDLRFSSSEAAEFLNRVMGLDLSGADITTLGSRTEGWIASLQLAAISLQGCQDSTGLIKSFTGSHRFVLDYLIEAVLEQQSEGVQSFLLRTTILDHLTGSLSFALGFCLTAANWMQSTGPFKCVDHRPCIRRRLLSHYSLFKSGRNTEAARNAAGSHRYL